MQSNQVLQRMFENAGIPTTLTTSEAAAALNRKPGTLSKWSFTKTGPIQPLKINGRLAWPVSKIIALLDGGAK